MMAGEDYYYDVRCKARNCGEIGKFEILTQQSDMCLAMGIHSNVTGHHNFEVVFGVRGTALRDTMKWTDEQFKEYMNNVFKKGLVKTENPNGGDE